jgi:MFS family permease
VSPTFDFFLFSVFSGAGFGIAFLFDSPYLLILGALLAPLMAPVIGISLGTVMGSIRTFARSLIAFLISSFIVGLLGALAGYCATIWLPMNLIQAQIHSQLWWAPFFVLAFGAAVTTATLTREPHQSRVPSVAIAYGLYSPLAAAGFGIGSGISHLWPDGLVIFALHLSWVILVGSITLAFMGFRPYTLLGYSLGIVVILIGIILIIGASGAGAVFTTQAGLPTQSPTPTSTITSTPIPPTQTSTPIPPTETHTPTLTPTNTLTPTLTQTPTPTPFLALVQAQGEFVGVVLRDEPGGTVTVSLMNGSLVMILPDEPILYNDLLWVRVLDLENDNDGWILQALLVTSTPSIPTSSAPSQTPEP